MTLFLPTLVLFGSLVGLLAWIQIRAGRRLGTCQGHCKGSCGQARPGDET